MIPCRNCGAELPEGAAFCPHCETALVEKRAVGRPHLWRRKTLGVGLALLAVFSLVAWAVAAGRNAPPPHEPQSYDGGAELLYESDGGAYHLLLSFDIVDWIPEARAELAFSVAPRETGIRNYEEMPARLYAYREESRETCREEFLALVESCTVEAVPAESARAMRCTQPEEDRSSPYVVLGSAIDYEPGDGSNDICWTLTMKNGDTIRMSQRLTIGETPVLTYRPEDTPLETAEELQALLDEIAETVTDRETEVRIFLPAVTYDEPILMRRACWLYGAEEGETTFTRSMLIQGEGELRVMLQDLTFAGSGSATGLASRESVILSGCTFKDWDIGVSAQETAWINGELCTFRGNGVGLLLNSPNARFVNICFGRNRFEDNGTGLHIEALPGDWTLDLSKTVFSGNGTDINNLANCRLDTSEAIFQ